MNIGPNLEILALNETERHVLGLNPPQINNAQQLLDRLEIARATHDAILSSTPGDKIFDQVHPFVRDKFMESAARNISIVEELTAQADQAIAVEADLLVREITYWMSEDKLPAAGSASATTTAGESTAATEPA